MRILHVNTARDYRGGERQTQLLIARQWREKLDVHAVVPPESSLAARLRDEGLPPERLHEVAMRGEVHPRAIFRIARICRQHRIQLLHLHTAHAHAHGVLAARVLRGRVRTVVSRRVDYPMATGALSRLKYRSADAFLAISDAVRRILELDGIPPERIHLVRSGIRIPALDTIRELRARRDVVRAELGLPTNARVVLNVGNLVDHKGQEILPRAARILDPGYRIVIAGEGPLRGELETSIRSHEVSDRVVLLGHRTDLPELYACADAYVQPSTSEGLGTAMLDAMAFELPVVATPAGGIPEAVRHEENGLLVEGRNPYLLGEAIKRVCQDRELAGRLGARGRAIVQDEFSDERLAHETLAAYRRILDVE